MIGNLRFAALAGLAALVLPMSASAQDEDAKTADEYQIDCDGGDTEGCHKLGFAYFQGVGVDADMPKAMTLFEQACEAGFNRSCRNMAIIYATGQGVDKNDAVSADYYAKGCDFQDAVSCNNLGIYFAQGRGVAQDDAASARYFTLACEADFSAACRAVGAFYNNGTGVEKNLVTALEFSTRACDGGDIFGCTNAGSAYFTGSGVEVNHSRAAEFWDIACKGDDMGACQNLGFLNVKGQGVPQNLARGATFYSKVCDEGGQAACESLANIRNACTNSFISTAVDGGFGPDQPLILRFTSKVADEPMSLFGRSIGGVGATLLEIDQPFTESDLDRQLSSLELGEAQVLVWSDGEAYYVRSSRELVDQQSAAAEIKKVCELGGQGIAFENMTSVVNLFETTLQSN